MTSDELRALADNPLAALEFAMKHGPDAARLLADAMDWMENVTPDDDEQWNEREALLARFAALGKETT